MHPFCYWDSDQFIDQVNGIKGLDKVTLYRQDKRMADYIMYGYWESDLITKTWTYLTPLLSINIFFLVFDNFHYRQNKTTIP